MSQNIYLSNNCRIGTGVERIFVCKEYLRWGCQSKLYKYQGNEETNIVRNERPPVYES
jgi:hypothetical protein